MQLERRTLPGESADAALAEVTAILGELQHQDKEFEGSARFVFGRDAYEIPVQDRLPTALASAATSVGCVPARVGMTFWTDAAILGAAGIPSVLFGPGGAGLHSTEEYVRVDDVVKCRDALVALARDYCRAGA
jgi:acetylornithine deacetylase